MPVKVFNCQRTRSSLKMSKITLPLGKNYLRLLRFFMVGLGRLELPTSPLSGVRSSHLSYRPGIYISWWSWSGSNRRPPECKSGALPAELQPLKAAKPRPSKFKSRPIGCRAEDLKPSRHSKQLHEFRARVRDVFPLSTLQLRLSAWSGVSIGMDWNGYRAYTQRDSSHGLFRKEVIQPQVLLRLPCYDFTPIMSHTLGRCLLAVGVRTSSTTHFRDVTGGVYKARERIHGGVLIRHY